MEDKEHYKEVNIISEDWLRREKVERLRLQFNKDDRNFSIQTSDTTLKKLSQDHFAKPTLGTQQLTNIKDKIPASANFLCSISAILLLSKSVI